MKAVVVRAVALSTLAAIASAQVPTGGDFRVNTYTTGQQANQRVAVAPTGDFVIAWTSLYQDGSGSGVFAQRYDAAGVRRGIEWRVNTDTLGHQGRTALATGDRGDFVVAWQDENLGPYAGRGIQARRYDGAGFPIGAEFHVNTNSAGEPAVAMAANSRFVVAWSNNSDGDRSGIAAQAFDADGSPAGSEVFVNVYTTDYQALPSVGADALGNFVVVWEDRAPRDGSFTGIFGRRFTSGGIPIGGDFQVNEYVTGNQAQPSIAMSPAGDFVVAWTSPSDGDSDGIAARRFDATANPIGGEFIVNTVTAGDQHSRSDALARDANGNFVIVWKVGSNYGNLFGQRFDRDGNRRGSEFTVNSYVGGLRDNPVVGSDAVGNFVAVWPDSNVADGSSTGVFARRFGGLTPAALEVDIGGNHVLEPREAVDIRPSWRNVNGAAQTFGGSLSGITGPVGGNYTITDPSGTYGTVADGSIAQCTDCYGVFVASGSPTRPAQHWDARVIESILPDAQGQQKEWVLHIGASFDDVPTTSPFYRFVEALLHSGATSGCGLSTYCPSFANTREQVAVFVLLARGGPGYVPPACTTPVFADVPASSPFCRWIEELARRGVVSGCGGGNYCPTAPVSREQMAVFVLRTLDPALNPPACTTPIYNDVPASNPFCRWIEELTRRSVVSGCGGGNYCPTAPVTREQMAVFISVTFGLTLYGP